MFTILNYQVSIRKADSKIKGENYHLNNYPLWFKFIKKKKR